MLVYMDPQVQYGSIKADFAREGLRHNFAVPWSSGCRTPCYPGAAMWAGPCHRGTPTCYSRCGGPATRP